MVEERIRLLKQIEILKEYNPKITIEKLILDLERLCSVDDYGTFDVILINGKNSNTKHNASKQKSEVKK